MKTVLSKREMKYLREEGFNKKDFDRIRRFHDNLHDDILNDIRQAKKSGKTRY